MPIIDDDEFGRITIRRSGNSRAMRATVAPNGTLRVSVPAYAPIFMVKRMIQSSRSDLRKLFSSRPSIVLSNGMSVGKSHTLLARSGPSFNLQTKGLQLIVTLGPDQSLDDRSVIESVREQMRKLLRKEAKAHLPRRIAYLAQSYGYEFTSLRFTHASSRWGSCNSKRAISLNIALMNLPFELIDYVLLHELAHTIHLNHSKEFWDEVAKTDTRFRAHRTQLKQYNPDI